MIGVHYDAGFVLVTRADQGSLYIWGGHLPHNGFEFVNIPLNEFTRDIHHWFYDSSPYRFFGFAFAPDYKSLIGGDEWLVIIPLWFPTALSALGLFWAWRRKRRKDMAAKQGFPVEAVKGTGEVAGGQ